ncbi:MAG: hypothetical protein Q9207_005612 [Kuettlingeria erythrocarpa]
MIYPSVTIANVETLPNHLHNINVLHLSNGSRLALKAGPSPNAHLLRHERFILENEASTLEILARSNLPAPRIFKYDRSSTRIGSPFILATFLPGASYAEERKCMNGPDRADIGRQIRLLGAAISQYVSSLPKPFGPIFAVAANQGYATWREAFKEMLESVLMDAEDLLINLPYAQIHDVISRLEHVLDTVTEPRLVVLGLSEPQNVLINRQTNSVTGMLDFGRALWGDWQIGAMDGAEGNKRLLYTIYHATVTIVKGHYRPQVEDAELNARKTLTITLKQLAVPE